MSQANNTKEYETGQQDVENSLKSIQVKNPTQIETTDDMKRRSQLKDIEEYLSDVPLGRLGSQFTILDSACSTTPKEASYAEIMLDGIEDEKNQHKQEAVYMLCKLNPKETMIDGKKKIELGVTQENYDSTCVMQFVTGDISCARAPSISDKIESIPGATMIGWDSGQKRLFFIIELTESLREINTHKTLYRKLMKRYEKLLGVEIIDYSDPLKKWHYSYAG